MDKNNNENKVNSSNPFPSMEEEVLEFWEKGKTFEKSVSKNAPKGDYVFYDGPPFATGEPHYGHLTGSIMKDTVPRYWTMNGYRVERKWGWDCHGLPIENIAEKELGITHKKEIETMGVDKFNEFCRSKVLSYVDIWKKVIRRLGRWADMENPYKTMDLSFMESVWWVFKQMWDKGLIYESYRSMYICPRCETTLSQSEVSEGYKMVKDLSVIAKFELVDEPGTYVLAWTTTPWTLIGNVALAVGEKIEYLCMNDKASGKKYILAKDRLADVLKYYPEEENHEYSIDKEIKGKNLIGKKYKPVFDYYAKDENLANRENGWKIYAGDFVTTEEGTGVVHIAPAFGEDDMNLGKKYNLPFIQHVGMDGIIKKEATDFAGLHVKPIEDVQATDVEIVKYLAGHGLLFHKEKYEHSYPHCWRCETPLINYATTSWFVKVTEIKDKALEYAKEINWSPEYIKEGRFGNWLEGARDWSISRQRYWASVIPLWRCEGSEKKAITILTGPCGAGKTTIANLLSRKNKAEVINGDEVRKELFGDIKIISNKDYEKISKVNDEIIKRAKALREENKKVIIDYVGVVFDLEKYRLDLGSDFSLKVLMPKKEVLVDRDKGRTEWTNGEDFTKSDWDLFEDKKIELGEGNYIDNSDISADETIDEYFIKSGCNEIKVVGSVKELEELSGQTVTDLHKHIIDKVTFKCSKCGGNMKRIPDVLDTWFDSGSMPYAQMHYPFENKEKFEANFPAEFIAEGIDQTRCWFYYLHIIGTAVMNGHAFNNVIVNGIVLAEDGKKMAKRLKNYPDPSYLFEQYSADAARFYLLSSPVMAAENLNFSENGVKDVLRGVCITLWNVFKFYEMYADDNYELRITNYEFKSENILDKWIVARLNQLIAEVTENMNKYNLPKATRPILEFINDFSTWYLRRSRDRFKGEDEKDKQNALITTGYVLTELAKVMAPFTPFIAEQIWQRVTGNNFRDEDKSVHLEGWPSFAKATAGKPDAIIDEMGVVRKIVELGLAKRDEAGIKVRQPLASLKFSISNFQFSNSEYLDLIKDEVNVKEIIQVEKEGELSVELEIDITDELKLEGAKRELVRNINNMRKNEGMTINDRVKIKWNSSGDEIRKTIDLFKKEILKDTLAIEMEAVDVENGKEFIVNGEKINIIIEKV